MISVDGVVFVVKVFQSSHVFAVKSVDHLAGWVGDFWHMNGTPYYQGDWVPTRQQPETEEKRLSGILFCYKLVSTEKMLT